MAKSTIGGVSTKQLASEVMKARYIHGDEWQDYIADKFEEAGIQPEFFTINDDFSDREADYQYEKNWNNCSACTFGSGPIITCSR